MCCLGDHVGEYLGVFCFAAVGGDVRVGGGRGRNCLYGWCECESRFANCCGEFVRCFHEVGAVHGNVEASTLRVVVDI